MFIFPFPPAVRRRPLRKLAGRLIRSGISGNSDISGIVGISGNSDISGIVGISGNSGISGIAGSFGTPGSSAVRQPALFSVNRCFLRRIFSGSG